MPDPVMVGWTFTGIDDPDSNFIDCNYLLLLSKTSLFFSDGISFDKKREPDVLNLGNLPRNISQGVPVCIIL